MCTVRDLLDLPSFQGTTILAGANGLSRAVEDVSVMEVPDIEEYVGPGSFLVSTLYPYADHLELLSDLFKKLNAVGLSGIGVKLNRYVSALPPECLAVADEISLPVLLLPSSGDFSNMANDYLKSLLQAKNDELAHRNSIHEQLMSILLRGDSLDELAKALAESLDRSAVLFDSYNEPVAESNRDPEPGLHAEILARELEACDESMGAVRRNVYGLTVFFYAVRIGRSRMGTIAIYDCESFEPNQLELITLQQFSVVFRIMVQHRVMMEDDAIKRRESLAFNLIYGTVESDRAIASQASATRWKIDYPITLIAVAAPPLGSSQPTQKETVKRLRTAVRASLGNTEWDNALWFENRSAAMALLDGNATRNMDKVTGAIGHSMASMGMPDYYLAESRTASALEDIPRLYRECKYTLDIQRRMRRYGELSFRELGVYRIIFNEDNSEELRSFCRDTLGALTEYDSAHGADLVETVKAVIECGGNAKAAANELGVHYNTVRYRCKLAEKLIGKSIDDPETVQSISLAIKINDLVLS